MRERRAAWAAREVSFEFTPLLLCFVYINSAALREGRAMRAARVYLIMP